MDYAIIKTFDNYFTAHIFLSKLQQYGIEARLIGEDLVTTVPFLTNITGGIKLVVKKQDAAKATELLKSFEAEQQQALICPSCRQPKLELIDVQQTRKPAGSIMGWLNDNYFLNNGFVYKCQHCGFETENPMDASEQSIPINNLRKVAMIPARYAATRFPYKLMQMLGDKPVIRHTYDNTVATELFDDVFVVTDSEIIFSEIVNNGGKAIISERQHESGSDRIAEALEERDADVVVNVQGDEPFVHKASLQKLLNVFEAPGGDTVAVASLMKRFYDEATALDPNTVKVVTDQSSNALYFSRSPIPHYRDGFSNQAPSYEHIGIYAYRKNMLMQFTQWPAGVLEQTEKLEQLRYLEHGIKIRMVETDAGTVKIDVPEDLEKATQFLSEYYK